MASKHPETLRQGAKICARAGLMNLRETMLEAATYIDRLETKLGIGRVQLNGTPIDTPEDSTADARSEQGNKP